MDRDTDTISCVVKDYKKKIVGAVFTFFEKSLKLENLPKITMVVSERIGIAINKINKTFTATKGRFNTHFGIISK